MQNNWCQHKDQGSVFQTPCLTLLHARASSQCLKANSLLNFSCRTLFINLYIQFISLTLLLFTLQLKQVCARLDARLVHNGLH